MPYVAPSLLAADFSKLSDAVEMINQSEADWLHLDIMDGRFVPNISFGFPILEALRPICQKKFDVHLMIQEPGLYAKQFAKVGADILSVHIEACTHLHRNIQQIKGLGMMAGIAINPHTPVSMLADVLADIDLVCVMSVNPGFGGQSFIERTYEKIRELRQMANGLNPGLIVEVDGGVDLNNATRIVEAGADALVAGSSVFKSDDPSEVIAQLKRAGN